MTLHHHYNLVIVNYNHIYLSKDGSLAHPIASDVNQQEKAVSNEMMDKESAGDEDATNLHLDRKGIFGILFLHENCSVHLGFLLAKCSMKFAAALWVFFTYWLNALLIP